MALLHWIIASLPGLPIKEEEANGCDLSSISRQPLESIPPSPLDFEDGVASKDVVIDDISGLSARIFLPQCGNGDDNEEKEKLPLFLYFHGGGFLVFTSKFPFFHHFCHSMAKKLKAIVVSVDYRLAPEHRLPAAYEDATKSLEWLQGKAGNLEENPRDEEDWIASRGDFSRVFLAGDSAGGNIALHVAMLTMTNNSPPPDHRARLIQIVGIVLIQPFYGGIERTESERRFGDGAILTMESTDLCWKMALPAGADRDHPYCNQAKSFHGLSKALDLPPVYILAACEDGLFDRQIEMARILEEASKNVVHLLAIENASHAFYLGPPSDPAVDRFFRDLALFVTNIV